MAGHRGKRVERRADESLVRVAADVPASMKAAIDAKSSEQLHCDDDRASKLRALIALGLSRDDSKLASQVAQEMHRQGWRKTAQEAAE